jgi:hypothetical protein
MNPRASKNLTINLEPEMLDEVMDLARKLNVSKSELMRNAFKLYRRVHEHAGYGDRMVFKRPDGSIDETVPVGMPVL